MLSLTCVLVFFIAFLNVCAFQPYFLNPPTWPGHLPYEPQPWYPPFVTGHRRLEPIFPQWNYYFDGVHHDDQRAPPQSTTYPPLRPTNTKAVLESPVLNTNPNLPQLYSTPTTTTSTSTFSPLPIRIPVLNVTRAPLFVRADIKHEEPTTSTETIFGLFNIVRFSHFLCNAGNGQNGTCYTASECDARGGIGSVPCAQGFGICCLFNISCNQEIHQNGSYFVNPRYPLAYSGDGSCAVTIPKTSVDVCQLRLDFIDFDTRRPISGDCNSDRLFVTGQNANNLIPPICGLNSGQHIYVDVDMAQGPVQLNMLTSGPGSRLWNIRISKIMCSDVNRAPANCLQYFTGVKGEFRSFNYDHLSFPNEEGYMNNLDYMICVRKEAGFCNIVYSNINQQFSIINVDNSGMPLLPPDVSGAGIRDCPNDYLNLNGTPLCGDRLNGDTKMPNQPMNKPVVDSTPGQFLIRFHTDDAVVSRGFNISYQQQPCGAVSSLG